jgi:choline dehydrogenase-like flavoprotein
VVRQNTGQNRIGFATSMTHQFYEHTADSPGSFQLLFHNQSGTTLADTMLGAESILETGRRFAGDPTDLRTASEVFGRLQSTGEWGDDLVETDSDSLTRQLGLPTEVEQLPDPTNRVTLDTDVTDNHGNPVPNIQISIGTHAQSTLEDAIGVQRQILSELDAEIVSVPNPANPTFSSHQMGTTRMGNDPDESVVDRFGVAHELSNLAVASAGVFVTGSAVNPTLTIVALGLRTADFIQDQL